MQLHSHLQWAISEVAVTSVRVSGVRMKYTPVDDINELDFLVVVVNFLVRARLDGGRRHWRTGYKTVYNLNAHICVCRCR
jgi:hypothetical protein